MDGNICANPKQRPRRAAGSPLPVGSMPGGVGSRAKPGRLQGTRPIGRRRLRDSPQAARPISICKSFAFALCVNPLFRRSMFQKETNMASFHFALGAAVVLGVASGAALAAGDLSKQTPIEVTVDLGSPGKHEFGPKQLKFETGKLYKLILRNTSNDPHYFTSHAFSQMVFTRKV